MDTSCDSCRKNVSPREGYGLWAGILLVILPKCPFCIMAFTGTALLCSEGAIVETTRTHNNGLTILITALLCLLTALAIGLKKRGQRTWYALGIAGMGMSALMYSVIRGGGQSLYYAGVLLVFIAVWLNGSLLWVLKGWRSGQWKPDRSV